MKKYYAIVLPLMILSLVGCKKGVTYTEVDDISMYYSEDNVAATKLAAGQLNIGILSSTQTADGMDYQIKRTIDLNYSYQYSKATQNGTTLIGKDLYLPNFEDADLAQAYEILITDGEPTQEFKSGNYVNETYSGHVNTFRTLVTNYIDNPLHTAKLYIEGNPHNLMWYKGSDGTLKVTCTNEDKSIRASTIIYAKTLYVKKTTLIWDAHGSFSYGFSYPKSVKHKTPADIGWVSEN